MSDDSNTGRVTGIGGVFFLAHTDHKKLAEWYEQHLGIALEPWGGGILEWKTDRAEDGGLTVWNVAAADSEWFAPSKASFMINYRVDDMAALLAKLSTAGVDVVEGPRYEENGVFAWIVDPQGNKIELWEPKLWDDKNKR